MHLNVTGHLVSGPDLAEAVTGACVAVLTGVYFGGKIVAVLGGMDYMTAESGGLKSMQLFSCKSTYNPGLDAFFGLGSQSAMHVPCTLAIVFPCPPPFPVSAQMDRHRSRRSQQRWHVSCSKGTQEKAAQESQAPTGSFQKQIKKP